MADHKRNYGLLAVYGGIVVVFVLLVVIVGTVARCEGKKEIDAWGSHVWHLQHAKYTLAPVPELPGVWKEATRYAVKRWNNDLSAITNGVRPFSYLDTGAPSPFTYLVRVRPATEQMKRDKGKCGDLLYNGDQRSDKIGMFAETMPVVSGRDFDTQRFTVQSFTIFVCTEKYAKGRQLRNSRLARSLTPEFVRGIVLHEFTHLFWWGHPAWLGPRTSAHMPSLVGLTRGEQKVLRRYVIPQLIKR